MDKIFKKNRWLGIASGALAIVIGVIMIVIAAINANNITTIISALFAVCFYAFALVCLLYGLFGQKNKIFSSFLLIGSAAVGVGTIFVLKSDLVHDVITFFTGTFFLAIGASELISAIVDIASKGKVGKIILKFIMFAIGLTAGILIYIYRNNEAIKWVYILVGFISVILGVITVFINVRCAVKEKKEAPIDNEEKEKKKPVEHKENKKVEEIEEKKKKDDNTDEVEIIDAD